MRRSVYSPADIHNLATTDQKIDELKEFIFKNSTWHSSPSLIEVAEFTVL